MPRWDYSGDVNLECGGTFFRQGADWQRYGYVDAVRVTPCSDAGGQDNAFWVERLTINRPDSMAEIRDVLSIYSYTIEGESGDIVEPHSGETIAIANSPAFDRVLIEACLSYGRYDKDYGETIQIGKRADEYHSGDVVKPDLILRGNCKLENYVRKQFLKW